VAAKFKLDLDTDFNFVKKSKQEQTRKTAKKQQQLSRKSNDDNVDINKLNIDKLDSDIMNMQKTNIDNINIHNADMQKKPSRREREPQSVEALRKILLAKLDGKKEMVIKMTEIATEIGFSLSWMQFAMKYLTEHNEFVFTRYAEGKLRGMKVTLNKRSGNE
jgi:hypothetical protein